MNNHFTQTQLSNAGEDSFALVREKVSLSRSGEDVFTALFGRDKQAFWLDSSLVIEGLSRYSIMGNVDAPSSHVVTYNVESEMLTFLDLAGMVASEQRVDIFDYMTKVQAAKKLCPGSENLPFAGGYIGYWGYELKTLSCGTVSHNATTPDAVYFFATQFLVFDHLLNEVSICALYKGNDRRSAENWIDSTKAKLLKVAPEQPLLCDTQSLPLEFKLRHNRESYLQKISSCFDLIAKGESYEICLTNEIMSDVQVDPLTLYRCLRRRNPAPYAAFLRVNDLVVACSSPERFLKIDRDGHVETKPIKGTVKRGLNVEQDQELKTILENDEKSRSENLMIVDLMRNDLGRVCESGTVRVPKLMVVESYETVHQLVSTITGQLRADESVIDCLKACFPGGSMTGAPKIRTMEFINMLEEGARGIYSGSIGYMSLCGSVDLNIVIRTIVQSKQGLSIGCGGAIVALSEAVDEFDEIMLKARAPIEAIIHAATGEDSDQPFSYRERKDGTIVYSADCVKEAMIAVAPERKIMKGDA